MGQNQHLSGDISHQLQSPYVAVSVTCLFSASSLSCRARCSILCRHSVLSADTLSNVILSRARICWEIDTHGNMTASVKLFTSKFPIVVLVQVQYRFTSICSLEIGSHFPALLYGQIHHTSQVHHCDKWTQWVSHKERNIFMFTIHQIHKNVLIVTNLL